ncbi:MAG: beta-propeller domain-containing protein [Patescibacteria group bacterium]|nr:beta-propeller domain-containing protein [Patescibacteria group bacterium]
MKSLIKIIVTPLVISFLITGCSLPFLTGQKPVSLKPGKNQPKENNKESVTEQLKDQSKIKKFASLEELNEFIENTDIGFSTGYGTREMAIDMAFDEAMPMAKTVSSGLANQVVQDSAGPDDFSKTNVQVEGVDEADIIKTDGKNIYALVKNDLYILKAYPAENAKVLSKISFKSRPNDLYINDNKLIIFGRDNQINTYDGYKRWKRRSQYTFFKIFDISDPQNPAQLRDLDFEGYYTNSRMIGDYVYFITTTNNYYHIDGEPVLPRLLDDGEEIALACASDKTDCVMPDIYYFDIPYNSYNFTVVSSINLNNINAEIEQEHYLMSHVQNMYMSPQNLYITYTKHISEYQLEMEVMRELIYPHLSASKQEKIVKIESVENYILNKEEKQRKIQRIIESWVKILGDDEIDEFQVKLESAMKQKYEDISKELEKTIIHKIVINKGKLEYKTNGEVTGHVLNQFSMDENDGYFRIATTKNRTWSRYEEERRKSYNNLYVLDSDLKQVGAIEGLAEDERIYSVRFMQGRAYMVTFKQIDPLFVIDLSDPTAPKVLGELKIPGFSNYLHPYDENTLIGLGKDTSETEWGGVRQKGLKLSLFDVKDVTNPKELDTYIMGGAGSNSIALNDHKAFLFDKEKNILAIPVSIREDLKERGWGELSFSGAVVFTLSRENGFELKGKIDHSDGGQGSESDYWRGYNYYDNTVRRCLYIDDTLYTFSNNYIMMNKISDLEEVKTLKLKISKSSGDDFEIVN